MGYADDIITLNNNKKYLKQQINFIEIKAKSLIILLKCLIYQFFQPA